MSEPATKCRIAVFIDWQNAYRAARDAFGMNQLPGRFGNFSPYRLGAHLTSAHPNESRSQLVLVEIHRGLPSSKQNRIGNAANRRQAEAWVREGPEVITPKLRPLRYQVRSAQGATAIEKGVDVQLALSAVGHVVQGSCDRAIIFSHDSDLLPAVETIRALRTANHVQTASWASPTFRKRIPPVSGVFNHFVNQSAFRVLEDSNDYARRG
mgnify:CR=1 FL=1